MKTIYYFCVILWISLPSLAQTNTQYYWSDGHKIYLQQDTKRVVLQLKKGVDGNGVSFRIKQRPIITFANSIQNKPGFCLITLKDQAGLQTLVDLKNSDPGIEAVMPYYTLNSSMDFIPTGEIIIQPKKGIPFETVFNLFREDLVISNIGQYGYYTLKVSNRDKMFEIANKIYETGMVDFSHPNFITEIIRAQAAFTPNDPRYNDQYYLNQSNNIDINAPEAWGISRGIHRMRVALIDDGIENHPDFQGRVVQGFTPTDPNGFGAPLAVNPAGQIIGHGEACAGIISASLSNNTGIAGIATGADIIPVNIFASWIPDNDHPGQSINLTTVDDIANGINWAWNQGGADVLSNSWNFRSTSPSVNLDIIRNAIGNARTQGRLVNGVHLGSIVVFSSGNENLNFAGVTYPANTNGVIAVGAIDRNGSILDYSSRGPGMRLVAPSGPTNGDIVTTDRPGAAGFNAGDYSTTFNGTSAACPQVSGAALLMLSINPNLTESDVTSILYQTATDMGNAGLDDTYGYGRLNMQGAVQQAVNRLIVTAGGQVCSNSNVQYSVGNIPANGSVNWSVSPTYLFTSSTSGTGSVANLSTNGSNGTGTIQFTISGPIGILTVSRLINVGSPNISNVLVDNTLNPGPYSVGAGSTHYIQTTSSNDPNASYSLSTSSNGGNMFLNLTGINFGNCEVYAGGNFGNASVIITATNSCGTSTRQVVFYIPSGYRVASNPAKDNMTVIFDDTSNPEALPDQLELVSEEQSKILQTVNTQDLYNRKAFKDGNKVVFDIHNYSRGTYYLRAINPRRNDDKKTEMTRLIFE